MPPAAATEGSLLREWHVHRLAPRQSTVGSPVGSTSQILRPPSDTCVDVGQFSPLSTENQFATYYVKLLTVGSQHLSNCRYRDVATSGNKVDLTIELPPTILLAEIRVNLYKLLSAHRSPADTKGAMFTQATWGCHEQLKPLELHGTSM